LDVCCRDGREEIAGRHTQKPVKVQIAQMKNFEGRRKNCQKRRRQNWAIMRGNGSGKKFELTIMRKSVGETMEKSETAMNGMEMEQFCC
jgi:hypothetical protein